MSDTVAFVVRLPAKPEAFDRMLELLTHVVDKMSEEPDFINTWIHRDLNEPNTIILYETWACSREHFLKHHMSKPYRQVYEAALPGLLDAPRTLDFMSIIASHPERKEIAVVP